ncbi:alpha/beta hydrolase [Pseudohalocynthiibacter aestuariivivens]|nr:alpha/beta hydrolase [Pseudohalocynthiibacter aestuariivivens]QIE46542.1 alpha/beta hydrolase [Pseudohalocynthiibacter aestuariivivens]
MDLDDAYANMPYIPDANGYPPRWAASAADYRDKLVDAGHARLDIPYGDTKRTAFDLFLPKGTPQGLCVFVHGGYWLKFHRTFWSHFAAGPVARGWAVAMPSYDLCPDVRISEITRQIAQAVCVAAERVAGPIMLTGHSAGGHLVARMGLAGMLPAPVAGRIGHILPISPVSDLRPLMGTAMNTDFRLTDDEAAAESPTLYPAPNMPVTVWVGGDERPVFLDQARWLAEAWNAAHVVVPGQHHFDVIEPLRDPQSLLVERLLNPHAR